MCWWRCARPCRTGGGVGWWAEERTHSITAQEETGQKETETETETETDLVNHYYRDRQTVGAEERGRERESKQTQRERHTLRISLQM